ncbi:MAG: hypothetical protein N3D12_04175 [Candidatus Methanomethyliaceae archaeon]|nr:hypothetical protein [Candidatus Methanomethyliaceae archaeon]
MNFANNISILRANSSPTEATCDINNKADTNANAIKTNTNASINSNVSSKRRLIFQGVALIVILVVLQVENAYALPLLVDIMRGGIWILAVPTIFSHNIFVVSAIMFCMDFCTRINALALQGGWCGPIRRDMSKDEGNQKNGEDKDEIARRSGIKWTRQWAITKIMREGGRYREWGTRVMSDHQKEFAILLALVLVSASLIRGLLLGNTTLKDLPNIISVSLPIVAMEGYGLYLGIRSAFARNVNVRTVLTIAGIFLVAAVLETGIASRLMS